MQWLFVVIVPHNMQYNIAIIFVIAMLMPVPVGCVNVQLHIAAPNSIFYPDPGFKKIRSLVRIILSRLNNNQLFTEYGFEITFIEILELPNELQKAFCHTYLVEVKVNRGLTIAMVFYPN